MASTTWKPNGSGAPTTIEQLREALTKLAKKKMGKALIDDKFTKDHIYAGHDGSIEKLASSLAKLREKSLSTLMISSMDKSAQAEVLNWVKKVPANKVTYRGGTWTISTSDSTVPAVNSYKFATVDLETLKSMNPDDRVKKSRKWLTIALKTPKVACQFAGDGTPMIYHLDY
ncbi:MAG TPA: hypothetical protein VME43_22425 [Bryobacteraceae bacterium]|nr:hypothetical protein [Bryobacteraceae bacterium]